MQARSIGKTDFRFAGANTFLSNPLVGLQAWNNLISSIDHMKAKLRVPSAIFGKDHQKYLANNILTIEKMTEQFHYRK